MNGLDVWAAIAAGVASGAMGLRAIMLKPDLNAWCDAPPLVRLSVSMVSAVFAGVVISIHNTDGATAREAASYTAVAIAAVALLINVWRQRDCGKPQKGLAGLLGRLRCALFPRPPA